MEVNDKIVSSQDFPNYELILICWYIFFKYLFEIVGSWGETPANQSASSKGKGKDEVSFILFNFSLFYFNHYNYLFSVWKNAWLFLFFLFLGYCHKIAFINLTFDLSLSYKVLQSRSEEHNLSSWSSWIWAIPY